MTDNYIDVFPGAWDAAVIDEDESMDCKKKKKDDNLEREINPDVNDTSDGLNDDF